MVPHDSKSDLPLAILLVHMHKKFKINRRKSKGGCQSGRKVVTHNSKSDLPLGTRRRLRMRGSNRLEKSLMLLLRFGHRDRNIPTNFIPKSVTLHIIKGQDKIYY